MLMAKRPVNSVKTRDPHVDWESRSRCIHFNSITPQNSPKRSAMEELEMRERTLRVVVRIRAKPDKVAEVRDLLIGLVDPSRNEPGCISYELLQNRDDPADLTFVQEWKDDSALGTHIASDHVKAIGPKLKYLVAKPPDVGAYRVVA
jgi:quinol monooxygenase YgiN